ncbi:hypothetical protein F9948_21075 [Burkholderia thailandensis]|nr:hypothetical protein [Burkholderia thailandensis]MDD1486460.1 hypothetical protein [Burkholderia thailandensis]MDD1492236.1 hypothetical protein [Burkholderia thailandensis]
MLNRHHEANAGAFRARQARHRIAFELGAALAAATFAASAHATLPLPAFNTAVFAKASADIPIVVPICCRGRAR